MDGHPYKLISPPGGEETTLQVCSLGQVCGSVRTCQSVLSGKACAFYFPRTETDNFCASFCLRDNSDLQNHSNILIKFLSESTLFLLSKQLKVYQSKNF